MPKPMRSSVLRQFYEIWGVGDKTAREFYYDQGWRELDHIIERGWDTLTRVQQIGLKYCTYIRSPDWLCIPLFEI